MACPNCSETGAKTVLLTTSFATPDHPERHSRVLVCSACTCPFYEQQIAPDYSEADMLGRGRVAFYLQQGAGLSLITRPLAQLRLPPGSRYLEVGCGFGFGLDYAQHARGWDAHGIDPGMITALGCRMLGTTAEIRYFQDSEPDLVGTREVVMASETVEHVRSPAAFIRALRATLRPGGTLILTTPDGADLAPGTPQGILVPLLSPGLHLIFQTRHSLQTLLHDAGFRDVRVVKDGHSLVAFASDRHLELETDGARLRAEYRAYLETRAASFPPTHDLFLAFAGRALQEAVNDDDRDQAARAGAMVERACIARYGCSLDDAGILPGEAASCSLQRLAEIMPLSLGGLLYATAIARLARGTPRAELGPSFMRASEAAAALRRAAGELAMEDGLAEDIEWTARAEAVLCSAAAGAPDIAGQLAGLADPPDGRPVRRHAIGQRALVELVNAGRYRLGAELRDTLDLDRAAWSAPGSTVPLTAAERDAVFCLAVLDMQQPEPNSIERGLARFKRVSSLIEQAPDADANRGLLDAARLGEALARERLNR